MKGQSEMYVYRQLKKDNEKNPDWFVVGYYEPNGKWITESDHEAYQDAVNRVILLNGTLNQEVFAEKLPLIQRFGISWDFDSQIKHIWLTGYLLITWEYDGLWDMFWRTLDFEWYSSGSYE